MNDQQDNMERVPPQDLDAEMCVLGSMLLSREAVLEVVDVISGLKEPFYRPAHETICDTILYLTVKGEPVDPITVADQLAKSGTLNKVGGRAYLHRLVQAVPTAANAGYYAEIVRNLALLRQVISVGTELVQMGYAARSTPEQAAEVLDGAAAKLQALTASVGSKNESREWKLDKILDHVMDQYDNPAGESLPLPWKDMQTGAPMEPGDLVVIAGRPGMGKTVALMEIARHAAIRHGRGVLVASMEMSNDQIGQRIIAAEAEVPLHHLRNRSLDLDQRAKVDQAIGHIFASPLRVDDTPARPVSQMRARLRQLQAENQLPAVLVVDYLQIAKAEGVTWQNRVGEVDSIAVGLKALAQEFKIVVIAAAQLNRALESRNDKTPTLADLRESGGIENNANIVILLHREDYYLKECARSGEFDFIVAKNRMGETFTFTAAWKGKQARIVDMARA
ncbi:replicative DNA helicase [Streptomyces sp. ME19-01-6]|uniref:replicative DNA helicase n=1 Tax=Streptomyces sp. ME19-01-6 TaxID=3028686 RepID=UPI0029AF7FDD|nr:replicative DNA helicase [Streptomyces sp. ME19-01-6]MDX3229405.1 replicative DNA helicase [Streptomyces sp. ME19-01-6]